MALTIYDIIRRPVLTEKTSVMISDLQKITFDVHPSVTKPMVKEALVKLFGVNVKDVNIIVRKGKKRIFKRIKSNDILRKRAIVTLKDSQSFDILAQLVSGGLIANKNTNASAESTQE